MDELLRKTGESDESYLARQKWKSFNDSVLYENRFFVKHELLETLKDYINNNNVLINTGSLFYRARIIDEKAIKSHMVYKCYGVPENEREHINYYSKSNPFRGLTKEASFIPPEGTLVGEGRANPKYIRYLYMSEDPTTALFEVRPLLFSAVNIAKIEVTDSLNIANIASAIDYSDNSNNTCESYLMSLIQGAFSKPTNNPDDYMVTQIITEYIKSLGFDGIRYNSSLHKGGVNYTVFNYTKCDVVASQDFRIENYKITARAAIGSANYHGDLAYIVDNEPKFIDVESFYK